MAGEAPALVLPPVELTADGTVEEAQPLVSVIDQDPANRIADHPEQNPVDELAVRADLASWRRAGSLSSRNALVPHLAGDECDLERAGSGARSVPLQTSQVHPETSGGGLRPMCHPALRCHGIPSFDDVAAEHDLTWTIGHAILRPLRPKR